MIEHNSRTAIGKSTDITIAGLINTYRVTNVSMDAAAMMKPFDNAISVIFGQKNIGGVRTGACDRQIIKRRRTRKVTSNIEAIRAISCDGVRAVSLVSDGASPSARPKVVTI